MQTVKLIPFITAMIVLSSCNPFEPAIIEEAKKATALAQKDPDSAKFDNVKLCKNPDMASGFVNSKNDFGAYSGRRVFFYGRGRVFQQDEADPADESAYYAADEACRFGKVSAESLAENMDKQNASDVENLSIAADAALDEAQRALEKQGQNR